MIRRSRSGFRQGFSLSTFIANRLRPVGRLLNPDSESFQQRGVVSQIGQALWRLISLPFLLLWQILSFLIFSWSTSRSTVAFAAGAPAALAFLGFVALYAYAFYSEGKFLRRYEMRSFTAVQNSRWENAEILFRRLVSMRPRSPEYKLRLAAVYMEQGESLKVWDLMDYMAPDDRPEYAPAHVWKAEYYLGNSGIDIAPPAEMTEEQTRELARRHLEYALALEPTHYGALLSSARFYRSLGDRESLERASAYYERLIQPDPRLIPAYARLLDEMGERRRKSGLLQRSISRLETAARTQPDTLVLWEILVECCIILEDYDAAERFIAEALQLTAVDDTRRGLQRLLARTNLALAQSLDNWDHEGTFRRRLGAIATALAAVPNSREALDHLVELVVPSDHEFTSNHDRWLRGAIVDSPRPFMIHVLLGIRAVHEDRIPEARNHWEIANGMNNITLFFLSNLSLVLQHRDDPQWHELALRIADVATDLEPRFPAFYEARGRALLRLGRVSEAVEALEAATGLMPRRGELRFALADGYDMLGRTSDAEEQREMGRQLEAAAARERQIYGEAPPT